jgi:hypothetical protein
MLEITVFDFACRHTIYILCRFQAADYQPKNILPPWARQAVSDGYSGQDRWFAESH